MSAKPDIRALLAAALATSSERIESLALLVGDHERELREKDASLASAQQRIEELERALGELVASHDDPGPADDMPGRGWLAAHDAYMARRSAAWAAARAIVACASDRNPKDGDAQAAPGRSPESAVASATRPSKGFLKGESPQATWPFAQDDKGTK